MQSPLVKIVETESEDDSSDFSDDFDDSFDWTDKKKSNEKKVLIVDDDDDDDDDFEIPEEKSMEDIIESLFQNEVSNFVNENIQYSNQLKQNYEKFSKNFKEIKSPKLLPNDILKKIFKSFENIKKYNEEKKKKSFSNNQKKLMALNVNDVLMSLNTFLNFMINEKNEKAKKIECSLFKLIFNPKNYGSKRTSIYSVYSIHDQLMNSKDSYFNFKSSTGSGKTRCSPFYFSIKNIKDDLKQPFCIMTQPGRSIINDKVRDFKKLLKGQVKILRDVDKLLAKYKKINSDTKYKFKKPIVALFSPINVLKLIKKSQNQNINIFKYTRFCLDEIHERSVEFDVLIAILSTEFSQMKRNNEIFPLQLLMMSATPDDRILKCFENVSKIELPESQLFPVETISKSISYKSDVNSEVIDQTFNIIDRMVNNTFEHGHILIFTSGNSRMNEIQHRIIKDCSNFCSSNKCKVFVISNFDSLIRNSSITQFYESLDHIINEETRKCKSSKILFVLPIKYLGYASFEQKEIGKNPIKGHPNVIKIIMATNAIESSITIDSLAAVIDTGLFNHATFNKINGLTSLMEEPISIQSRIQRKGRVGRVRPGICVQIGIKGENHPDKLPPAIQTSDITLNILSLRKIGIKLEDISNLPDKIDPKEMKQFISELVLINALDSDKHELTAYGKFLTEFSMVSPFIASAILSVAGFPKNSCSISKTNINDLTQKELDLLLGILISYIFASPDLCVNVFSKKLQEFFDKRSDIITLLRAFLELVTLTSKEIQKVAGDYGLNTQNVIRIKSQMQQISGNLFKLNQNDKEINWSSLWTSLFTKIKNYVQNLISCDKLYPFIQRLIINIGQNKPEWLKSRTVNFLRIENANFEPSFVYKDANSLSSDENESIVFLKMRPGAIGLDCPGHGFILNITQEKSLKMNFGSIIHTDLSLEDSNFIPHPISIEISDIFENDFSEPMINGYLTDYMGYFQQMYLFRPRKEQEEKTILTFKTKDYLNNKMHYYLSIIPTNTMGIQLFNEAISYIEKLMPYTPSTILIKKPDQRVVISLHGSGTNNLDCTSHSIDKEEYFAYKINTQSIKYLVQNIEKVNSSNEIYSIAMTGEWLCFLLDDSNRTNEMNSSSGLAPMPQIVQKSDFVFYDKSKFHSNLVFVSNHKIEQLNNYSLKWFSENRRDKQSIKDQFNNNYFDYSNLSIEQTKHENESFFIQKANKIASKIIDFEKSSSFLVFTPPESKLIIKGDVKINENDPLPSFVEGKISNMFYNYALKYINNSTLNKPIDLDGFFYKGQTINNINLPDIRKYNLGNGSLCYLCFHKQTSVDQLKNRIMNELVSKGIVTSYENVPEYTAYIKHLPEMNISLDTFVKRVTMVVKQFGGIMVNNKQYENKRCEYKKHNFREKHYYGSIKVFLFSKFFLIPFAKMISEVLQDKIIQFNIPNQFVDNILMNDDEIKKDLSNWFKDNNIRIFEDSGSWYGTESDIQFAIEKFKSNPPQLSYVGYSLSNKCNILSVYNQFNRFYRKQGFLKYLNKSTMTLYLPKVINIENILNVDESLYKKDNNETKFFVNMFSNGRIVAKKYDINHVYSYLKSNLNNMYDSTNDYYNLSVIRANKENIQYISLDDSPSNGCQIIPFGQKIWLFVNEPKIANLAKTYITAKAISKLTETVITQSPTAFHPPKKTFSNRSNNRRLNQENNRRLNQGNNRQLSYANRRQTNKDNIRQTNVFENIFMNQENSRQSYHFVDVDRYNDITFNQASYSSINELKQILRSMRI